MYFCSPTKKVDCLEGGSVLGEITLKMIYGKFSKFIRLATSQNIGGSDLSNY